MSLESILSEGELSSFLSEHNLRPRRFNGEIEKTSAGFHTVYFAEDIPGSDQKPRRFAVKVPNSQEKLDELIEEGLEEHPFSEINEDSVRKQKRLRHPQVPVGEVYKYKKDNQDIPIIIEDYAPGKTLEELAKDPNFFNMSKKEKESITMEIFRQLSNILSYFEEQRIFHNDLKIDNIKVDFPQKSQPYVYILDMNLSRDYNTGVNFEPSRFFRAPERYHALRYHESLADQFSLGLCIYYLWNRTLHVDPTVKTDDQRNLSELIMTHPDRFKNSFSFKEIPRGLRKILKKTLSYHPPQRFDTFKDLEHKITQNLPGERRRKKNRRRLIYSLIGSSAIIASSLAYTGYLWTTYKTTRERFSQERIEFLEPLLKASIEGIESNESEKLTPKEKQSLEERKGLSLTRIGSPNSQIYFDQNIPIEKTRYNNGVKLHFNVINNGRRDIYDLELDDLLVRQKNTYQTRGGVVKNISSHCGLQTRKGYILFDLRYEDDTLYVEDLKVPYPLDFSDYHIFDRKGDNIITQLDLIKLNIDTISFETQPYGFYETASDDIGGFKDRFGSGPSPDREEQKREKKKQIQEDIYISYLDYVSGFFSDPNKRLMKQGYYPKYLIEPQEQPFPESHEVEWTIEDLENGETSTKTNHKDYLLLELDEKLGSTKIINAIIKEGDKEKDRIYWDVRKGRKPYPERHPQSKGFYRRHH